MRWSDFIFGRLIIAVVVAWSLVLLLRWNNQQLARVGQKTVESQPETPKFTVATLLFTGDLMFDRSIRDQATKYGNEFVFKPIADTLHQVDYVVANVEGPITDFKSVSGNTTPADPRHFKFTFPVSLAQTLATHNITVVNLGNNHILNFGKQGLEQTIKHLDAAGVTSFGYTGVDQLSSSATVTRNQITVGFVNYNQFSEQTVEMAVESIKQLRPQVDYLVVYTHWDNEYQLRPAARTVTTAHQFIDAGADLIIGSHPHVVQFIESYQGKQICYSLGNFVFDQYFEPAVKRGLLVKLTLQKDLATGVISADFADQYVTLKPSGQTQLDLTQPASKVLR